MISQGNEMGLAMELATVGYKNKGFERKVFSDLSLAPQPGALTCLVGPNGAGKSTLLYSLGGMRACLSGTIRLNGRDLERMGARERAALISFVFTENPRLDYMSVFDVVALGRSPRAGALGGLRAEDVVAVEKALDFMGISDFAQRQFTTLSDGESQKALVARALAQDCPYMLLDEPTVFLDHPSMSALLGRLRDYARAEGKTVVVSLHEVGLALTYADYLWVANPRNGIVQAGLPEEMALSGEVARAFGLPFGRITEINQAEIAAGFTPEYDKKIKDRPTLCLISEPGLNAFWTGMLLRRLGFFVGGKDAPARGSVYARGEGAARSYLLECGSERAEYADLGQLATALEKLRTTAGSPFFAAS
jgi:iron complex transport system ATP-binding protein